MTRDDLAEKLGKDKTLVLIPGLENEVCDTWKVFHTPSGNELCFITTAKNATQDEIFDQIYQLIVLSSELVEELKLS